MKFSSVIAASALASTVIAAPTDSTAQEPKKFLLYTELRPGQEGKERFEGQHIEAYHTGAGLSDATITNDSTVHQPSYLVPTNRTSDDGTTLNDLRFDLGTEYPFAMNPRTTVDAYSAWQPVTVDGGPGESFYGFFLDNNGLNWANALSEKPAYFGGWIVCDWWHGVPQLFIRNGYYNITAPETCAEVFLKPKYI